MAKVDLWLKGVREGQKILAIKALREHLDLGLRAAKDRVEAAPSLLAKGMELSEAERLSAILTEAGVVTNLAVKERAVCVDPRDPARGDQTIVRLWRTPIRVFEETGKFGANGTVEERGFDSEDEAQRELARRIEKQRAAGRLVFAGDTEALAALSAQHAQLAPLAGSDQEAAAPTPTCSPTRPCTMRCSPC